MYRKRLSVYVTVFNAVLVVAFIFSNIYYLDFLNTQINLQTTQYPRDVTIVPFIQINGLQVTVSHSGWTSTGAVVPTALPSSIPNYPFIIFWIAIAGNLILVALILRKQKT